MITNMNLSNTAIVSKDVLAKLSAPIEKLTNQRHNIVFIYPFITTDHLGGSEEEKIIRKFMAISLLKEIEIEDIIKDIEVLIGKSEQLNKDIPSSKSEIINYITNLDNSINDKLKSSTVAYLAYQILSNEKTKIIEKSSKLAERLKQIINKDPYYQQYQSVISFRTVANGIQIPIIVGTKNFQVSDAALTFVLLLSLIFNLPLDSISNVSKLEQIVKSRTVQQILDLYEKKLSKLPPTEYENVIKKLINDSYIPKRAQLVIKVFHILTYPFKFINNTFNKFANVGDILFLNKKYNYYLKLTSDDINQVFTVLKLCTNIHYYTTQLNDRFSEILIKTYDNYFKQETKNRIITIVNKIFTYDGNITIDDFPETQKVLVSITNEVKNDIKELIDSFDKIFVCDEECHKELGIFILNNIEKLVEISEKIKEKEIDVYDIGNIIFTFYIISNAFKYTVERIFNELEETVKKVESKSNISGDISNYAPDKDESLTNELVLIKSLWDKINVLKLFKNTIDKAKINLLIDKTLKKYIDEGFKKYEKYRTISLEEFDDRTAEQLLDVILKELDAEFFKDNKYIKKLYLDLLFKIINIFKKFASTEIVHAMYNDINKYIEQKKSELMTKLISRYGNIKEIHEIFDMLDKQIKYVLKVLYNSIQLYFDDIFIIFSYIVVQSIIDEFLKYTNVTKFTFDESNLKLEFPNYILFIHEQILKIISSTGILYRRDILEKISFEDLEPKKILNPVDFNLKYTTEFFVRALKIPSIAVLSLNKNAVVYKTHYMKKVEKTNIDKIKEFCKLYDVTFE